MRTPDFRTAARLALAAGLAVLAASAMAQSQQVQARIISTAPVTEANGSTSFNVTYEYEGRQYTTRTTTPPPGATLPIEVNAYGVATMPVMPQAQMASPVDERARWQGVAPEPGVVVSAGSQPAPGYYPAPVYTQPVYTQPVYVQPAYAYPYAYAPAYFPPIGLSLNLGYSRGWGGGHRGWR